MSDSTNFIPSKTAGDAARKLAALEYIAEQMGYIRAQEQRQASALEQINMTLVNMAKQYGQNSVKK